MFLTPLYHDELNKCCPPVFMKLSSVVVCWPVLCCGCVWSTHVKLPPSPEVLCGLCRERKREPGWFFQIHCAEEINEIARGLLMPFKRRNTLSPKRMWKKLEQLHLYHEPLYRREWGKGIGNAVEVTGCGVPILCSTLNSWAKTGTRENIYQYFS